MIVLKKECKSLYVKKRQKNRIMINHIFSIIRKLMFESQAKYEKDLYNEQKNLSPSFISRNL